MLERINISAPLLCWAKTCLTDITGRVVVNRPSSLASDRVPSRISPLCHLPGLFLQAIRANPGVAGYPLLGGRGERRKVLGHMDSITSVTTDSCSIVCATKGLGLLCGHWNGLLTVPFPLRRNIKLFGVTSQSDGGGGASWEGAVSRVQTKSWVLCPWQVRSLF